MAIDRDEAKEVFERFLMDMDDQLEALEGEAASRDIDLDLTDSSVEKLEKLFGLMAATASEESIGDLVVTFGRYLGEIVRSNYGGRWTLSLDDPRNPNVNTPVITGHAQEGLEFAPISVMRAFALRRTPGTLRQAIEADIDVKPIDLSGLIEE